MPPGGMVCPNDQVDKPDKEGLDDLEGSVPKIKKTPDLCRAVVKDLEKKFSGRLVPHSSILSCIQQWSQPSSSPWRLTSENYFKGNVHVLDVNVCPRSRFPFQLQLRLVWL